MPKKGHKFGKYEKPRNPRNPNARMSPLRDSADGTTSLVAVDVGLTALGWARWNRALPAEAGGVPVAPDAAGVIELPSRRDRDPWDVRATAIMAEYVAGPWAGSHGGFGGPPRVQVIEWPAYWAGDAKGNAAAAGEALGGALGRGVGGGSGGISGGIGLWAILDEQAPGALQEAVHALDVVHRPGLVALQRAHEHLVKTQRVGPVLAHDLVGVYDVAARLGHLLAVFAEDHPLVDELLERLGHRHEAGVIKDLGPYFFK